MIEGVRWFQEGNPKHLKEEMLLKMIYFFFLGTVFSKQMEKSSNNITC